MDLSASGYEKDGAHGGWAAHNDIKCQDSSNENDACASKLSDTFVIIYDTDHDLADNALKVQPTNKPDLRVEGSPSTPRILLNPLVCTKNS